MSIIERIIYCLYVFFDFWYCVLYMLYVAMFKPEGEDEDGGEQ